MANNTSNTLQYEETLEGITGIEVQAEHINISFVTGEVTDRMRLEAESVANAPQLSRSGSTLRINQGGRYRSRRPVVVALPPEYEIPIAVDLGRGDLAYASISGPLAANLGKGDVTVEGGVGEIALKLGNGDVAIVEREGAVAIQVGSGDLALKRCRGDLALKSGRGDITAVQCAGTLDLRLSKGDVLITDPVELAVSIRNSMGDIVLKDGSVRALRVQLASGDVISRTRLLYVGQEIPEEPDVEDEQVYEPEPEPKPADEGMIDIGDHGVRFNLGSMQFRAGDDGVRFNLGGQEVFRADSDGVELRRRDGSELFAASSEGVNWAHSGAGPQYSIETSRGDIAIDIPDDQAARVELLVHSGSVHSDIPLVEVGRPGPRGATRRYVGVTDGSERERILVSARTHRGDLQVRYLSVEGRGRGAGRPQRRSKDEQRRSVLEALNQGKLTVDEAQVLIAAIERER